MVRKITVNMKKITTLAIFVLAVAGLSSCVESSGKYQALKEQLDSLQADYNARSSDLDQIFGILNEVERGLTSIRESENIIAMESKDGLAVPANSRERMISDIQAIQEAIDNYQKQIEQLKKTDKIRSEQFRKRLEALSAELKEKSMVIESLSKQLEEKDAQIVLKTRQIASLDQTVSALKNDITNLSDESALLQKKVAGQEKELYSAYYITGTKNELIEAGVMTKGGLFKSAKISYQAQKDAFVRIDYREITTINTNAKKAKILSGHPKGTYAIEEVNDEAVLTISDPEAFWEQTKYLVIQIQ